MREGKPVPFPSSTPDMRILEIQARDSRPLTLWKNTEDAYAISSTTSGPVVLTGVALSPTSYWSPPAAWWDKWDTSRTVLKAPDSLERSILEGAGVEPTMQSNREVLEALTWFFREFQQAPLAPGPGTLAERIIQQKTGVCRHRAILFQRIARHLGWNSRVVSNEAHVFVELNLGMKGGVPRWVLIDLGGGLPDQATLPPPPNREESPPTLAGPEYGTRFALLSTGD